MTRQFFIERTLRQIYNGQPTDDSSITVNLVNGWLDEAIALAAKKNYTDSIQLDGVGYVNNSFYSRFRGLAVTKDERFTYKVALPQIPVGIGRNEGISSLQFKDSDGNVSFPCIPLSENQRTYNYMLRPIPNKTMYYYEGDSLYAISTIILTQYTATITMISGGDGNDLTSTLNVPGDYLPVIVEYIKQQLLLERNQPQDQSNDGSDNK